MIRDKKTSLIGPRYIFAVLSALLLILSFPGYNLSPLAWTGFVPLLLALQGRRPFEAFLIAYVTGVTFFLGTIYWLIHVTLPGMIVVALYLALYFGLFGAISSYCLFNTSRFDSRTANYGTLVFIPAVWVALELARSVLLGGFGWNLIGHSQAFTLPVIQIADMTGVYGVSFLILIVNAAIFLTIRNFRKHPYHPYLLLAILLVLLSVSYGVIRLKNIFTGNRIKVAVVQGNIPQAKKWDMNFRENILSRYEALTRSAAAGGVDLVVWPETSVPGYLDIETDLSGRVSSLSKSIGSPILVGAPNEDPILADIYYNTAALFGKDGNITDRYNKMHLVPFGEYVPFKKFLSLVERFAPSPIGDFSNGTKATVFSFFVERSSKEDKVRFRMVKRVKFSTMICFEDIFSDIARNFVRNGADFLVNITNDAWFAHSSAPYQHAENSIFRAVENRVNVVRAANTGLSCFIDQKGAVTGSVSKEGRQLFVDGFRVEEITLTSTRTFYTMHGDMFAYACVIFSVLFLAVSIYRKIII